MNLTEEQSKVVFSNCRINACLACPGSGKTTVLVARAERLWNDFHEPILIVTFSNKAVKDITKKLSGEYANFIKVQTIHSLCYSVVKEYWPTLGEIVGGESWPKEAKLVEKLEEMMLIEEMWPGKDSERIYDKFCKLREFNLSPTLVIRIFKKGVYFGKYSQQDLEMWDKYEKYRLSKGLINFDDMTNLASMIMPLPEVAVGMSKKFQHVLIDEAQDTSESQWVVLRPLVAHAKTTLAVGDLNQSIYGWRNADGSVLSGLGYLQDAVVFRLTQSFRSGSLVAKFANVVVRDKSSQIKTRNAETPLNFKQFDNKEDEVDYVLKHADKETAIIARTNSYLEVFERECIKRGISYMGMGFYRSTHIKALHKFVENYEGDNPIPLIEQAFLDNASYTNIEKEDFKMVIKLLKKDGLDAFKKLVRTSNAMNAEGVTLTTGHGAKGLQWPKVFVVGAHEGQIPHRLSKDDDEERNLFYVMVTREAGKGMEISYVNEPSRYIREYQSQ